MGPSEDRPDRGVGAFVAGVGDPVEPGVGDLIEPGPEGFGEADERWELRAEGPADPFVE